MFLFLLSGLCLTNTGASTTPLRTLLSFSFRTMFIFSRLLSFFLLVCFFVFVPAFLVRAFPARHTWPSAGLLLIRNSGKGSAKSIEHAGHLSWDWQTWTSLEGDVDGYEENLDVNIFVFFLSGKSNFLETRPLVSWWETEVCLSVSWEPG